VRRQAVIVGCAYAPPYEHPGPEETPVQRLPPRGPGSLRAREIKVFLALALPEGVISTNGSEGFIRGGKVCKVRQQNQRQEIVEEQFDR
jgi:hypothetical protein